MPDLENKVYMMEYDLNLTRKLSPRSLDLLAAHFFSVQRNRKGAKPILAFQPVEKHMVADCKQVFDRLAGHFAPDGYIQMCDSATGDTWRWIFDGTTCIESRQVLAWPKAAELGRAG